MAGIIGVRHGLRGVEAPAGGEIHARVIRRCCSMRRECRMKRHSALLQFARDGWRVGARGARRGTSAHRGCSRRREETKGNEATREAAVMKSAPINFTGNVEGRVNIRGCCRRDCRDGFTANVGAEKSGSCGSGPSRPGLAERPRRTLFRNSETAVRALARVDSGAPPPPPPWGHWRRRGSMDGLPPKREQRHRRGCAASVCHGGFHRARREGGLLFAAATVVSHHL